MDISKKILMEFINKGTLNGAIDKTILYFDEKVIRIKDDFGNVIFCVAKLNTDSVDNYKAVGEIGIKDIPMFKKFIDRFMDTIEININKNLLIMRGVGKTIETKTADPDFIEKTELEEGNITFGQKPFTVRLSELKEIVKDVSIFLGTKMIIDTKPGELKFSIASEDNVITKEIPYKDITHTSKVELNSEYFKKIVDILSADDIKMNTKTGFPLMLGEEGEKIKTSYFLAPMGGGDEEEEQDESKNTTTGGSNSP